MPMRYATVTGPEDVDRILQLQALNHRDAVDPATAAREGFTSVRHAPDVLQAMNRQWPSVVAWAGTELAGYCLMMPRDFRAQVPILQPMFALLDTLHWKGRALATDPRWFVMGQVCVAHAWRGQGVFDGLEAGSLLNDQGYAGRVYGSLREVIAAAMAGDPDSRLRGGVLAGEAPAPARS